MFASWSPLNWQNAAIQVDAANSASDIPVRQVEPFKVFYRQSRFMKNEIFSIIMKA